MRRGARLQAEVGGYGLSCDAYHITRPHPDADGEHRRDARGHRALGPRRRDDVDFINAHGTGTKHNDAAEAKVVREVFGDRRVPISSMKSMLGHCMGAASALEAIGCVFTLETGIYPPTIGYETPDPECDLDVVANVARARQERHRPQQLARVRRVQRRHRSSRSPASCRPPRRPRRRLEAARDHRRRRRLRRSASAAQAFFDVAASARRRRLGEPQAETFDATPYPGAQVAEVPGFDATKYLGDKGLRSLDRLTKLLVVAARLALHDAGLKEDGAWARSGARVMGDGVGIVVSNAYGSLEAITELDRVADARGRAVHQPVALPAHRLQQRRGLRQHLGGPARAQRERERRQLRRARRGRLRRRDARARPGRARSSSAAPRR